MAMSYKSRAQAQLVESLAKSRNLPRIDKTRQVEVDVSEEREETPEIEMCGEENDISLVKTLKVPEYDKNRKFPGLTKLKIAKKDRHMAAQAGFAQFLDETSEKIETNVLTISRAMREMLEGIDSTLFVSYSDMENESFLVVRGEKELFDLLFKLRNTVRQRSEVNEKFGVELDNLETKRAEVISSELKVLVDTLVGIAHQLPDDIEHYVESETHDLNTVLTSNRQSHSQLLGLLRKRQAEVDIETQHRWNKCRELWRHLRHVKALHEFDVDIRSTRFHDPNDRSEFLGKVVLGQEGRQAQREVQLDILRSQTTDNIASTVITSVQQSFLAISEAEIAAIQDCYNGLNDLRASLRQTAQQRVEALRRELHQYGALKLEPDLESLRKVFQSALDDDKLSELWRLGGGLKPEVQGACADLSSPDVVYDRIVTSMLDRFQLISCGFDLKRILAERGRAAQLDKVRNLITKLRTVGKNEIPNVVTSLLPELHEIMDVESVSALFRKTISDCAREMTAELELLKTAPAGSIDGTATRGGLSTTTGLAPASRQSHNSQAPPHTSSSTSGGASAGHTATRTALGGSSTTTLRDRTHGSSTATASGNGGSSAARCIDPLTVKLWNRKLGILYFCCDLPMDCQEACLTGIEYAMQQRKCNELVDQIVREKSEVVLNRLDRKYKQLIDQIANFLEAQAGSLANCAANLGDFFLLIAKAVELHRKQQHDLDERAEDELWDLSEDFRLELEDREALLESYCQKIRESNGHADLQSSFEEVLVSLEQIQDSYRVYHKKACFAADKYPLHLSNDFKSNLNIIAAFFKMVPMPQHPILQRLKSIFDETVRLNKSFFEADGNAAGIPLLTSEENETIVAMPVTAASDYCSPLLRMNTSSGPASRTNNSNSNSSSTMPRGSGMSLGAAPGGVFAVNTLMQDFVASFFEDGTFAPPEPLEIPESSEGLDSAASTSPVAPPPLVTASSVSTSPTGGTVPAVVAQAPPVIETHAQCCWLKIETAVLPLPVESYLAMDEDTREEYDTEFFAMFAKLSDTALASLSAEEQLLYAHYNAIVDKVGAQIAQEKDPIYQRTHPPLHHQNGNTLVKYLEIESTKVSTLVTGIRDGLVVSAESEAHVRIAGSIEVTAERKTKFTDELEDRLRTHWPRRGRVETQIKQPREAELLGHEEKTWRYIQSIQQKMKDVQASLMKVVAAGKTECDEYVSDVVTLRNSLINDSFRNLAALQGVDVRARSRTIEFQSSSAARIASLNQITDIDCASVVTYARDFRRVCPLQAPGVDSGYSDSEIAEIEGLVEGQCGEIDGLVKEWKGQANQLTEQQLQSLKTYTEFCQKYEKCTNELAMSEGLGQKYGAPRRRAQERIRTEISRDDQAAGRVDEVLAQLEFACSEAQNHQFGHQLEHSNHGNSDAVPVDLVTLNGRKELNHVKSVWLQLVNARNLLFARAEYLQVLDAPMTAPGALPWMAKDRIPSTSNAVEDDVSAVTGTDGEPQGQSSSTTSSKLASLQDVFHEVDSVCRKETQDLYKSEGKADMLGASGVPESLQTWLTETREKVLGRHGHLEKAWKRLWAQVERLEVILARKATLGNGQATTGDDLEQPAEDSDDEEKKTPSSSSCSAQAVTKLGVPGLCFRYLTDAFLLFVQQDRIIREDQFSKMVKVWETGREKNERLLRPRLGSPDAADELSALDEKELSRSRDMIQSVKNFRCQLVIEMSNNAKLFCEDISICSAGLMQAIDSCVRQELLKVPPDTNVPKKRMTLKRMRKLQRIKEAAQKGGKDESHERRWPSLQVSDVVTVIKSSEIMVTDWSSVEPPPPPKVTEAPVLTKQATKVVKKGSVDVSTLLTPVEPPSLVTVTWQDKIKEISALQGAVSTAHRILVEERNSAIAKYMENYSHDLESLRGKYDLLLQQEQSWNERWNRQVEMLRRGCI